MIVGYARVSTTEQGSTDALNQQIARLKKAGAIAIYQDIESGKSNKRDEFNKLLDKCESGDITEIIITRLDRLSRSVITIHRTIAYFEENNIKLTILDAPIDDLSNPVGWFAASQASALAEFESRMLSQRIRHGMEYFRSQKKASSRPPFGFARINEKYAPDLSINQKSGLTNWDAAKELIEYFLKPNSTFRSACLYSLEKYDKSFTPVGFRYWINSPVLRGHTAYGIRSNMQDPSKWEYHYNTHEPLISEEIYETIKERINENRSKFAFGVRKFDYPQLPLQGQLFCGSCGYRLNIKRSGKYKTQRVICKKRESLGGDFCKNKYAIRLPDVIKFVDDELVRKASAIAELTEESLPKVLENPEVKELEKQLRSLKQLPESEIINNAIIATENEIERLQQIDLNENKIDLQLVELLKTTVGNRRYWKSLSDEDKRIIYKKLVDKVIIFNGEVIEVKLHI